MAPSALTTFGALANRRQKPGEPLRENTLAALTKRATTLIIWVMGEPKPSSAKVSAAFWTGEYLEDAMAPKIDGPQGKIVIALIKQIANAVVSFRDLNSIVIRSGPDEDGGGCSFTA